MNEQNSVPIAGTQEAGQEPRDQATDNSTVHPNENGQSNSGANAAEDNNSIDWTKDSRYGSHWKGENNQGDPNKMYETVKYLESRQGDYDNQKSQFTDLQSKYEEMNKNYQDSLNYNNNVKEYLDHPVLGQKINDLVNSHNNDEIRAQYGSDLNDQQISAYGKLEDQMNQLSNWQKTYEEKESANNRNNMAMDNMDKIKSIADDHKILWNDEAQKAFVNHCQNSKVPVENMKAEFYEYAMPDMQKHWRLRGEEQARESMKKGSQASLGQSQNGFNSDSSVQGEDKGIEHLVMSRLGAYE